MDKIGKIFQAIPKIMSEMEAITKDRKNVQQNFMFRGIDDLYNALQKLLARNGVFTVPVNILQIKFEAITSKQGSAGYHITNQYTFRFYCDDSSSFEAVTIGEAVDYGDKASNKAAAIAHKYALLQVFCIPTEEEKDPDFQAHEIKPKPIIDQPKKEIIDIPNYENIPTINKAQDSLEKVFFSDNNCQICGQSMKTSKAGNLYCTGKYNGTCIKKV